MSAGPTTVAELHRELIAERDERVARGVCGCGCETSLPPKRHARTKYVGAHKDRAHRERIRREAELLGLRDRLSLSDVRAAESTGARRRDAQSPPRARETRRRAPRPGVSLYLPRPELVERVLASLEYVDGLGIEDDVERDRNAAAIEAVRKAKRRLESRRSP